MRIQKLCLLLVMIAGLLIGCSIPSQTQGSSTTVDAGTSTSNPEPDLDDSDPTQSQGQGQSQGSSSTSDVGTRTEDQELNVDSITLEQLCGEESHVFISQQGDSGVIFRFYVQRAGFYGGIECYQTEKLTKDFLNGTSVVVVSAYKNTISWVDFNVFQTRLFHVAEEGKTIDRAQMLLQWDDARVSCIVNGATGEILDLESIICGETDAPEGDDCGLRYLVYLLYELRGTGIQHF